LIKISQKRTAEVHVEQAETGPLMIRGMKRAKTASELSPAVLVADAA